MLRPMFAATFWGILTACAVFWIESETIFWSPGPRPSIPFIVGELSLVAIGGPFAFLTSTLLFAGLDWMKDRLPSRARLTCIGVLLGAVLGYASFLCFLILQDATGDWVTLLHPKHVGPLGPAVLIGGAVLGFRLAWTCKPQKKIILTDDRPGS